MPRTPPPARPPRRSSVHPCKGHCAMIEALEKRVLLASYANGLSATYWDNFDFTGPTVRRVDSSVNFNWRHGSPDSKIVADTFSARWTGVVQSSKTEAFTFYTSSDDGVRLFIDGKRVINKWDPQNKTEHRAVVNLTPGRKHAISLEYFERRGAAVAELAWSSPSTPKQIVPNSALFHEVAHAPSSGGNNNGGNNGGGTPGNGNNNGGNQNPPPPANVPPAPQGVAASVETLSSIEIVWSDVAGESSYNVERAFDPAGPWHGVGSAGANATRYLDRGLLANTRYFYRVRAVNAKGPSAANGSYA